jgi:hypothetical protein
VDPSRTWCMQSSFFNSISSSSIIINSIFSLILIFRNLVCYRIFEYITSRCLNGKLQLVYVIR